MSPLKKHSYPQWVCIFGLFLLFLFLCVLPLFLWYELPYHRQLSIKLKEAEQCFLTKNYKEAIQLYANILEEHPYFKKGKIHMAQSCFALSTENQYFFEIGLLCLADEKYSTTEISEIDSFIPAEYKENFKSSFKRT